MFLNISDLIPHSLVPKAYKHSLGLSAVFLIRIQQVLMLAHLMLVNCVDRE